MPFFAFLSGMCFAALIFGFADGGVHGWVLLVLTAEALVFGALGFTNAPKDLNRKIR